MGDDRIGGPTRTCRLKCNSACFHDAPNNSDNETFGEVVARGLSRRSLLKAGLSGVALLVVGGTAAGQGEAAAQTAGAAPAAGASTLGFRPIQPDADDVNRFVVPRGYGFKPVIRWGDPITPSAPNFAFSNQRAAAQANQFGYNCDFVKFNGLPDGDENTDRGLLWVNHEYVIPEAMFPGFNAGDPDADPPVPPDRLTREQVLIELAALGGTVVEVRRDPAPSRLYSYVRNSRFNRRITASTPMQITGPARGHDLVKTNDDPSGTRVLGMLGNCAGGRTPYGTILTAEENFDSYFGFNGDPRPISPRVRRLQERYGLGEQIDKGDSGEIAASESQFEEYDDRFNLAEEPNEPFRFGYIVEIDPYDPNYVPRKRTALGRMKHEGAASSKTGDGRVALYMGDDEAFDYVYKFVTRDKLQSRATGAETRRANDGLLDHGTLYVARFDVDGQGNGIGRWIPLKAGQGPLTAANGFANQGDVSVATRLAADLVGATKMDRPEDVARDPKSGRVYINLTNNSQRYAPPPRDDNPRAEGPNPSNPRGRPPEPENGSDPTPYGGGNLGGHVIELTENGDDSAATTFTWDIFLLVGDPEEQPTFFSGFPRDQVSPIANPDNLQFDGLGNILLATDGQPSTLNLNDAFHFVPLVGPDRGKVQQFLSVPTGAEACGPDFTRDLETLFCAVQHPAESFPDPGGPPRPSVMSIEKRAGNGSRRIGT